MKKINRFGYTKLEVLIVIVLLGIVAFVAINKTSYAFAIDNTDALTETKQLIEMQAEAYALANLDLFKESETTYILVDDLVKAKYLIGNSDNLFTNPTDSTKNYNENKIKLEYNSDKKEVVATLIN